ncbi:MAG: phage baseplate assembly protein V [Rhizobiales bacterium]|nr:phage baseplate assembly protein V [Hyphomicrobiales bacterium]
MSEAYRSAQFKRGVVVENDPKKGLSRVRFEDEDDVSSYWLAWNMPAAGGSKVYNAPDLGSQVNALVDRHGEDGVILGARYSEADAPPTQNGKLMKALMEGGLDFEYDKASGSLTLKLPAGLTIEAGSVSIKGPVAVTGASMTHNGANVGETHRHGEVRSGPSLTGPPAG